MTTIRSNEDEFKGQVIHWINQLLDAGGYPFEVMTAEVSVADEKNTLFPDTWLWVNLEAREGFCGWELKPTTVKADDQALLANAIEKARRMKARYFVSWNMQDAIIWEVVDEGGAKKAQRIKTYERLPIGSVQDLTNPAIAAMLRDRAHDILIDLAQLKKEGHLTDLSSYDWFFIHRLTDASRKIQPFFRQKLFALSGDPGFRQNLNQWAFKQGFAPGEQENMLDIVARQIVYQLLGRLLFLEVLRRFQTDIKPFNLEKLSEKQANIEIRKKFAEIRSIDYQAIFEEDLPDSIPVPKEALPHLAELLDDLGRRDFANLPQEVLGTVFENLIPPDDRHRLGQYFTQENLVDFIAAFCVRRPFDCVLDPTCGTGTFLLRAYDRFRWAFAVRNHQKLLGQIWGIDIAPFPAELATINLYRQDISDFGNFPRILKKDFFEVRQGQEYEFPPNKPFAGEPNRKIKDPLPAFDAIIGNPPYIRQEQIDRAVPGYNASVIIPTFSFDKRILADKDKVEKGLDPIALSGQADIYAYMFVHAAAMLKEGGRLGFVTSNSWLGSEYGQELQSFFLRHFKIIAIVESRVEPWFETAQVNTIFTILERCENQEERENHLAKFVSIKKKLRDLIHWDMQIEAAERWRGLDVIVSMIESVGQNFVKIKSDGTISAEPPRLVNDLEDSNFRIRTLKQGALAREIPARFGQGHWGRFLRAPGVYFELREVLADKLVSLSHENTFQFNRGVTGGVTEFFTISKERIREFGIEKEFLVPFITSFREIEKPMVEAKAAEFYLFNCHLEKNDLRRLGKKGALKYIEWGEKQKTSGRGMVGRKGVLWPDVPSVKSRQRWYDIGERNPGDVLINRFMGERIFFPTNSERIYASDTFFELNFVEESLKDLWAALMNSAIAYLVAEVNGRVTWSAGVLYLYGPEIRTLLLPDAREISDEYKEKILQAFQPILKRKIKKISEEVRQKDRQVFDGLVLEALGLPAKKYLDLIYSGLTDLVEARVALGKMQAVEKKAKKTRDIPKIKEEVLKEVLSGGVLRPFPESFVAPRAKYKDVVFSPGKWRLGDYFLGKQELVNERGEKFQAETSDEAAYILFAQKPDSHIVRLPIEKTVIQQAVQKYKIYMRDIRRQLMREFVMRTGDQSLSERLSAEVLEELGILF